MKRIISICLALICIAALSLGFAACNGEQIGSEAEGVLGADLGSLTFYLDGVVYTLPLSFSDLEVKGWTAYARRLMFQDNACFATDILEPESFATWTLTDGEQYLTVMFTNLSEEALLVSESSITGILTNHICSDAPIIFPGNIMLGSTYEDVIAAYWDTENRSTSETSLLLHFSAEGVTVAISIDKETNLVSLINMHYFGWMWQ